MSYRISPIKLTNLRNEEHFGFHSELIKLVGNYSINETFQEMRSVYLGHYKELDAVMEMPRKSDFTSELAEVDAKRNETFRSFRLVVEGFTHYFEEAKRRSAVRLNNILHLYGNLPEMPRDARTYAMANMLQDMQARGSSDVQALGLGVWVDDLEANNTAYKHLKECRYEEQAQKSEKRVRDAHKILDSDYRGIVQYLDAMYGILNPMDSDLKLLANELEARIEAYSYLLVQRRGIRAAKQSPALVASVNLDRATDLAVAQASDNAIPAS
jgi:hypothetical protein